jgi:hypothetical protein
VVDSFEHGNEPLGSIIKGREFLDQLSDNFSIRTLLRGVS